MIIINKDKTNLVNFEQIENIFIGNNTIKANMKSGKGMQLGAYNSLEDTKIAMEVLIERLLKNNSFIQMPSDNDIKAKVINSAFEKQRSLTGKKQKGYGGS